MYIALDRISPIVGGIIAGVLHTILSPDHLCSIVTLSACQGAEAFWFGVRWAGGHLTGMVVLCAILVAFRGGLNLELYEYYMYYFVGSVLIVLGSYFVIYADEYFDDEWAPKLKSCACHNAGENTTPPSRPAAPDRFKHFQYGTADADGGPNAAKHASRMQLFPGLREMGSALLGFAQGLACPGGVMGMMFLKDFMPFEMLIFITIFFAVTILAMGLLAMAYGVLTRNYISSKSLGRAVYYVSCVLSLAFGLAWIVLNYTGHLEALLGHDHHGHAHHGHGEEHNHADSHVGHDHSLHDTHLRRHAHG